MRPLCSMAGLLLMFSVFTAAQAADNMELGIEAGKPVFGGACRLCPWGVAATFVREAMKPDGYDVRICRNCSTVEAPRLVGGTKMPPPVEDTWERVPEMRMYIPRPPQAPVDFGAVGVQFLWDAYRGTGPYSEDGPYPNLRLLANLQAPTYLVVAARSDLNITSLAQIRENRWPVRILIGFGEEAPEVLAHYGLTREEVRAAGGDIRPAQDWEPGTEFDIVLGEADFTTAPEFSFWNEISQRVDLTYLRLPDKLLERLAKENERQRVDLPVGFLKGVTRPIPTVAVSGIAIYGRDDMPDSFAYDVAAALDRHQGRLQWHQIRISYNRRNVWKAFDVPLHPGAERYYREAGYLD